jgi:hypothetical protein
MTAGLKNGPEAFHDLFDGEKIDKAIMEVVAAIHRSQRCFAQKQDNKTN